MENLPIPTVCVAGLGSNETSHRAKQRADGKAAGTVRLSTVWLSHLSSRGRRRIFTEPDSAANPCRRRGVVFEFNRNQIHELFSLEEVSDKGERAEKELAERFIRAKRLTESILEKSFFFLRIFHPP